MQGTAGIDRYEDEDGCVNNTNGIMDESSEEVHRDRGNEDVCSNCSTPQ